MKERSGPSKRRRLGAAATGAGVGTLLTFLVQTLPDENGAKKPLLLAIPTLSVGLSATALFCARQAKVGWLLMMAKVNERSVRNFTQKALSDNNATPAHREQVRRLYEEFERNNLDRTIKRTLLINDQRLSIIGGSENEEEL